MKVKRKLVAFYLYRRLQKRRQHWVHPLNRQRDQLGEQIKIDQMYQNYPKKFFEYTRMSPKLFDLLLALTEEKLLKKDTNFRLAITPKVKLYVTLRFLATGDSIKTIATNFSMGNSTVWKILKETTAAIWEVLAPIYVKVPTKDEWDTIVDEFESRWNFPNCFGAVDGTFSIVLLGACDANYCFTMVDVGACGRQSDGGVFASSKFGQALLDGSLDIPGDKKIRGSDVIQPCTLVGDEGFGLSTFMMRPYAGDTSRDPKKRIFNYRLSRARRIIENVFGILVSRFRVFQRRLCVSAKQAERVVKATIALHNFLRKQESLIDESERIYCPTGFVDRDDSDNGEWRKDVTSGVILKNINAGGSNNYTGSAKQMRDNLAQYFVSKNGSLPWQNERAVLVQK